MTRYRLHQESDPPDKDFVRQEFVDYHKKKLLVWEHKDREGTYTLIPGRITNTGVTKQGSYADCDGIPPEEQDQLKTFLIEHGFADRMIFNK